MHDTSSVLFCLLTVGQCNGFRCGGIFAGLMLIRQSAVVIENMYRGELLS